MKKIGIFGGSFDPVHNGHVELAKAAVKELQLDKLYVVPANVQPFKQDKNPSKASDRLAMLRLAFEGLPQIEVSSYEIDNSGISYTYNTLSHFKAENTGSEIIFIMGGDSILTLEKWYAGDKLLTEFSFAVATRPGYQEALINECIQKYQRKYKAKITKISAKMPDISATEIRDAIASGEKLDEIISGKVLVYLKEHNLYA